MNNNKIKNIKSKKNTSLMNSTRSKLVEIILRKDKIEKDIRSNIKILENKYEKVKKELDILSSDYDALESEYNYNREEYNTICDENTSIICELNNKLKFKNYFIYTLEIILFVSVILNVIPYIY